ncbi:toxin-antitoxin system, toxin component, HicA domain protein [Tolypothrix sp. PCC 7601]|nr:toxin-antitoxin system, toxin component, HicA domain protein [Tolypothrix sp. PCC 7601]
MRSPFTSIILLISYFFYHIEHGYGAFVIWYFSPLPITNYPLPSPHPSA